ncbi:hypothetical protein ACFOHU_10540 [Ottowia pentelensis]|uniref:Transmembrane protein n=1 Tax=Ottowia pentelensis TaxID=511108 RepID=A0ABV6PUK9_9BURK|nr:hypothetical protein [Ottowia sp.]
MLRQRLMWIAWPAFMVAAALEMMVFAVLDPLSLTLFGETVNWPRETIYSVTFFIFWVMLMLSSGITLMLARPAREVNGFDHPEVVQPPPDWTPPDVLK